ncbi:MAG: aromatic amino acid hydroxylase [Bdellovibrionia bacterium]
MINYPLTEQIPPYLTPYIAEQNPSLYTPLDHASWRFIMKVSEAYFPKLAHGKYLKGLKETGISTERIPLVEEIDQCLRKFNWRAVAVTGFIPPSVFTEFLSLGVLPIACDMRSFDHLAYTPAPDIVHEAAGHAPIIADAEYSAYLRSYGEISRKAIFSNQDMDVYNAIRHLSDTKEDPNATFSQIEAAQSRLNQTIAAVTYISEATLLSRMGWWTFEYGLVGPLDNPKIYGAGLLSSLSESYNCLSSAVKKVPFSIECIETSYDITKPQPQLFVAEDFHKLTEALDALANKMAFRKGGIEGLEKAKKAGTVTTTELDSGVQISGNLAKVIQDSSGMPRYLQFQGPTQLAYKDAEIQGQGARYHKEGYGTPLEDISDSDLKKAGVALGKKAHFRFASGISVEGKCTKILHQDGSPILLSFEDCTVKHNAEILFQPEWGTYDMVCGGQVVSVFGGAADRKSYLEATGGFHQDPGKQKSNLTEDNKELNELYGKLRSLREAKTWNKSSTAALSDLHLWVQRRYPSEWLFRYELLELLVEHKLNLPWAEEVRTRLKEISQESPEKGEMIKRGLELL